MKFAIVLLCFTTYLLEHSWAKSGLIVGTVNLVNKRGEKLKNAEDIVVYLENIVGEPSASKQKVSMSSDDGKFVPNVLPIFKGTTVHFPNNDPIFHNVFSLSKIKRFDLGLYKTGAAGKSITFSQEGIVVVYCNIHEKMKGHIVVLPTSHFTLTDKNGDFKIENVPGGSHTISVWYRYGKQVSKKVTMAGASRVEVNFDMVQTRRKNKHHKNKWGKAYKAKY